MTTRNDGRLKAIAEGRRTYALALDEGNKHDPDRHPDAMRTRDGNGFRLTGTKTFVVDGGLADRLLVLARTDEWR